MRSTNTLIAIAVVAISLAPVTAAAQEGVVDKLENPKVIDRLFECRTIENPEARLACFDREVGAVYEAQESRELVIAEREQVEEAKRGLFGLTLPKIRLFGGGDGDQDIDELTAVLAGARVMGNGLYEFELEDGARWVQTEKSVGRRRYGAGDTIVISKGAIGSFKAKVNGERAMRVRRVN